MSTWRLWNDARTEKKIQEDFTKLYEQPNPQKEWIKAMYEQDSTMFHHFVDTIEKKLECDWDFICFEDRDAYLLYTLIDEYYWHGKMHNASYKIICAEDLSRNVEVEDFAGKKVLVLGIILSNGCKMFKCYCQLKKLGVKKTVSIVFGFNTDTWGFKKYYDLYQGTINQIYCDIFGASEENILKAKTFYEEWFYQVYGDVYFHPEGVSKVQLQIVNLFHRNSYLKFEKLNGNSDETYVFEIIRGIVMRSTRDEGKGISIKEIEEEIRREYFVRWQEVINDVLQLMKDLGIVEERVSTNGNVSSTMLQWGKNADWLVRGEGKLCYLCIEPLYILLNSKQKFISCRNEFLLEAKKICSDICYDYRQPFYESIFDFYIEWYNSMTLDNVGYHIMGQRLWSREGTLTAQEKKIHDTMAQKAVDINHKL